VFELEDGKRRMRSWAGTDAAACAPSGDLDQIEFLGGELSFGAISSGRRRIYGILPVEGEKRMRIPGLILGLAFGIAACDGDNHDDFVDTDPVVVLSQHLVPAPFDECDVVGQALNTDGDVHCDASVQVNAFGRSGAIIDQGFDSFANIPPNTIVDYRAILTVPCGAIARIETSVPNQACFD
jgi:hypothetical protein